ncbi:MAG TPA: hypothetical protein VLA06_08465 [Woeseiaceae bacterium]|jgi:hypothetical protein|nr:hypothetical protein [Woeseiaceae bacterium]
MDIVIAAEKPSIASLLSEHTHRDIAPEDIQLMENPNETGSFYIGWQFKRFMMSPDGRITNPGVERHD